MISSANFFPGLWAAHSMPPRIGGKAPSPCNAEVSMAPQAIRFRKMNASSALDFPLALVPINTVNGSIYIEYFTYLFQFSMRSLVISCLPPGILKSPRQIEHRPARHMIAPVCDKVPMALELELVA